MPLLSLLHRLLPFATPGTPLLQDVAHLAALCLLLYCGPHIQQRLQARSAAPGSRVEGGAAAVDDAPAGGEGGFEWRNGFVGADDDDDDEESGSSSDEEEFNHDGALAPEPATAHAFAEPAPAAGAAGDAAVEPDPANPRPGPIAATATRNVGAKKAKSLARRDQRRAYNEFLRSQGDAQRAADAAGQSAREAAEAAERERRRAAEAVLEARKAREREERRAWEREARARDAARREAAVALVGDCLAADGRCDLSAVARRLAAAGEGDVDDEWMEAIVKASGLLGGGNGDGSVTMLTGMGWVVRVTKRDMAALYEQVVQDNAAGDAQGRIGHEELGKRLETVLRTGRVLKT